MKAMICISALVMLLTSCTQTKYIPVETVRHDSIYLSRLQRDSIYVRDSLNVERRGDTVYVVKTHTRYRDRLLRDTAYVARTDTIRQTVTVEVEKPLTWWQRVKMQFGVAGMAVILGVVIGLVSCKLKS